jgi:hypothetical protein
MFPSALDDRDIVNGFTEYGSFDPFTGRKLIISSTQTARAVTS